MTGSQTRDLTFRVARFTPAVDALATVVGRPTIVLRSGDCLHVIDESRLNSAARDSVLIDLDKSVEAPLVVAGLEPDASLAVAGSSVIMARRGGIEFLALDRNNSATRLPLPDFGGPVVNAAASPEGTHVLCVVRDESDADLSRYDIRCLQTAQRIDKATPAILSSSLPPRIAWSARTGGFIVLTPCNEKLWRIAPGEKEPAELEIPKSSGRSVTSVFLHPTESWLAAILSDANDGGTYIAQAILTPDAIRWDTVTRLPDGLHRHFRWRPAGRELLAVRSVRRSNTLVILNALGGVISSCDLPRGWHVSDACWTGDGRRALVAGSVGVGVWTTIAGQ